MSKYKTKHIDNIVDAARCQKQVSGFTHSFYSYPARFSPLFASAVIECFSKPGDVVLDPYMGGGTTIVEAMVIDRRAIGVDLNSLAVFVAKVKTTILNHKEIDALNNWGELVVPSFRYNFKRHNLHKYLDSVKTKNLHLTRSRFIKKLIAVALESIEALPTKNAQDFAKCAILQTSKWALDGSRKQIRLSLFRSKLKSVVHQMLNSMTEFKNAIQSSDRTLIERNAKDIPDVIDSPIDLIVTSPPYPGVHVLYHRWQVDGRKETPAPYWIAGCNDGMGASYYNFGSRHQESLSDYFQASLETIRAIRKVMKNGAFMVQMIAFNNPSNQLPKYLDNMNQACFEEVMLLGRKSNGAAMRIWRQVPGRKWHANLKGKTNSSREVVLIHRAI